jgi:hypothetical protein
VAPRREATGQNQGDGMVNRRILRKNIMKNREKGGKKAQKTKETPNESVRKRDWRGRFPSFAVVLVCYINNIISHLHNFDKCVHPQLTIYLHKIPNEESDRNTMGGFGRILFYSCAL